MGMSVTLSEDTVDLAVRLALIYDKAELPEEPDQDELALALMHLLFNRDSVMLSIEKDRTTVCMTDPDTPRSWQPVAIVMGPDPFANVIQACVDLFENYPEVF